MLNLKITLFDSIWLVSDSFTPLDVSLRNCDGSFRKPLAIRDARGQIFARNFWNLEVSEDKSSVMYLQWSSQGPC